MKKQNQESALNILKVETPLGAATGFREYGPISPAS